MSFSLIDNYKHIEALYGSRSTFFFWVKGPKCGVRVDHSVTM